MKKIRIISNQPRGKNTWNSVTRLLHEALERKTAVEDFYIDLTWYEELVRKAGRLFYPNDFNRFSWPLYTRKYRKMPITDTETAALFIGDSGSFPSIQNSYIYQDLSVDSLLYCMEREPELFRYSGYMQQKNNMLWRSKLQKKNYEKLSGIFVFGKWLVKNLVEHSGLPSGKVYHVGGASINIDKAKIDYTKKSGNKILFVGRDFKRKGGELVLDAFETARHKRKDIQLYIAGCNNFRDLPNVYWLGDRTGEQLYEYFNLCDIFCMPSYFEAYGIVFIEALTFGLPCIGRNQFAMPEMIEHGKTGFLVGGGGTDDRDELAGYMLNLLENREIINNVRAKRAFYENEYSWDAVAERMFSVINGCEHAQ